MSDSNLVIIVPVAFRLPEEIRVIGARYHGYRASDYFFPGNAYFAEATGKIVITSERYASMEINVAPRADGLFANAGHYTWPCGQIETPWFDGMSGMLRIKIVERSARACPLARHIWELELDISSKAFEGMRIRDDQEAELSSVRPGARPLKP